MGLTVNRQIGRKLTVLSNHYVHTGYHEIRTHRRDSVHVLAVTNFWRVIGFCEMSKIYFFKCELSFMLIRCE